MTADWVKLPYEVLEKISNRIINEVDGVNGVVYDISSKPPSTMSGNKPTIEGLLTFKPLTLNLSYE